ncbi:MAG: PIN domain-containing protein [Candidatus Woesearchaeota archaeon]
MEKSKVSDAYFLDTHAIIQILIGAPTHKKFISSTVFTAVFNLAEASYILRKHLGDMNADKKLEAFWSRVVHEEPRDAKSAADLKLQNKTFSYIDGLGYAVARRLGVPFVTGDTAFKELPGVLLIR